MPVPWRQNVVSMDKVGQTYDPMQMTVSDPMKIGIIGCGKISGAYFGGAAHARNLEIKACADLRMETAEAAAAEHGCAAMTVDRLLADPEIELVVNLTIPAVHVEVGIDILAAGKHVYAEKPLAVSVEEGKKLVDAAADAGLRIGSAPDTFLFKAGQTARKAIDDGWIGRPLSGTAFFMSHGPETWHPNPGFYYDVGGGPLFDLGPYYITALINFLGPIRSVMARTARGFDERVASSKGNEGKVLPVSTNTHCTGVLEFESGVLITMITSFDVWRDTAPPLAIHGTEGSIEPGDPNNFENPPKLFRPGNERAMEIPFTHADNERMIGVVDMVDAIRNGRPQRAGGELAFHVLEVMEAFDKSSESGLATRIESTCERPEALPSGLLAWEV